MLRKVGKNLSKAWQIILRHEALVAAAINLAASLIALYVKVSG